MSDAHVLTRQQLEKRVCDYIDASQSALKQAKAGGNSNFANIANICLSRALDVENLYQERFRKKTKCWAKLGEEEKTDPK